MKTFLTNLIIFIMLQNHLIETKPIVDFDKDFFGVDFRPYTKFHEDHTDYTISEVEDMLKVVSKRFQIVSTLGMGTIGNNSWQDSIASGFASVAASNINKRHGHLSLKLYIGIHMLGKSSGPELNNAFEAAEEANKNFNGTVQGVTVYGGIVKTSQDLEVLKDTLKSCKTNAIKNNLKLGVRLDNCEALSNIQSIFLMPLVKEILNRIDYIICFGVPKSYYNVEKEIQNLTKFFLNLRQDFKILGPNVKFIAQTSWPSFHKMNGKYNSSKSVQFWLKMGAWAKQNEFPVFMIAAFDEPTRVGDGQELMHYGWWKRINEESSDGNAFVEKIYYSENSGTETTNNHVWFVGLIILSIVLLLSGTCIGGGFLLYRKLVAVQNQLLTKSEYIEFREGIKLDNLAPSSTECEALIVPYDKGYEISRSRMGIEKNKMLGSGTFGCVFEGKVDGKDVAIKTTKPNSTGNSLKSLLSEIKILIHVGPHPNVVSIIGANTEGLRQGIVIIAIELCEKGSLDKYLKDLKEERDNNVIQYNVSNNSLTNVAEKELFQKQVKWCYDIACGMEYISSKNVIHADLATRNVLLTANYSAKITDFGLSRKMYEYSSNYVKQNQEPLPWRWMALESLDSNTFSTKSDIWAYGVTLWEIFSLGNIPYPGLNWTMDFVHQLRNGLRLDKPDKVTPEIYSKMIECWSKVPKDRPNFTSLASFMGNILHETQIEYVNVDHFSFNDEENVTLL